MSRYRKIDPRFWKDERVRRLSSTDKLVALYVFTGQANRIGCFNLSVGMAAEDLGLRPSTFQKRLRDVCRTLRWEWDEQAGVLYLPTWWKYNHPENPNNVIGNLTDLDDVVDSPMISAFCRNTTYLAANVIQTFTTTLAERYAKRMATQEQEQEQEQEPPSPSSPPPTPASPADRALSGFEDFWAAYPKHVGKSAARKAWIKAHPSNGLADRICAAVATQRLSPQWQTDHGRFIPHPATWLNQQRWDDDPHIAPTQSAQPTGLMPEWTHGLTQEEIMAALKAAAAAGNRLAP